MAPAGGTNILSKKKQWTKNYLRTFRNPDPSAREGKDFPKHITKWISELTKPNDPYSALEPHLNCGIPNHAFYLAAVKCGGNAWENIDRVWYNALIDPAFKEARNQNFKGWADLTCTHAAELLGSEKAGYLKEAWTKVGVYT